jgi:hypothetical protein
MDKPRLRADGLEIFLARWAGVGTRPAHSPMPRWVLMEA